MKFNYTPKDQFTKTEVEELLTQHEGFIKKSHIAKEEYDKVNAELSAHKKQVFDNLIDSKLNSYDAKQKAAIKKIASFKGIETADEIDKIIKGTIEEFPFIASKQTDSLAINQPKVEIKDKKKPSPYLR